VGERGSECVVLLAEDNEDNQAIYATFLEHHGYRVVAAWNGEEALTAATTELPDVVLMDLSMPVLDGWQALRRLRADPRTQRIPVIALTAHALATERANGLAMGFDSYITKPAAPAAVLAEIRRIVGASRG